jgi:RNA polymerase sigma factor (sigma-70 family)
LLQAIARLPETQRQIIELRHRQGLAHAEVAERLHMTAAAARQLWSRTVHALRNELSSNYEPRPTQPRSNESR